MLIRFDRNGNASEEQYAGVTETLCFMDRGHCGVLYAPTEENNKGVAVVIMHSDENYMGLAMGPELAMRGYMALAIQVWESGVIDRKLEYLGQAVKYLKGRNDVKKVVLMGHSGGATTMTAYQAVAENGPEVFQGEEKIFKCTVDPSKVTPADGLILIDANYGNGVMSLISLDPAVRNEGNAMDLDPQFDIFDPANGYDKNGANYTPEFRKKYRAAQVERNNRLIALALERFEKIEKGEGNYADDEPFVIAGGSQVKPNNRMLPEDLHIASHTRGEYDLIHADGSITHEQVMCLRTPEVDKSFTSRYDMGINNTTVKSFLSSQCIRTTGEFAITEDNVIGVDWNSSYASAVGNIEHVSAPLLLIGLTGGYEYMASELIWEHARMADKEIAFIRGAEHNFVPNKEAEKIYGSFGQTDQLLYDKMADWMKKFI